MSKAPEATAVWQSLRRNLRDTSSPKVLTTVLASSSFWFREEGKTSQPDNSKHLQAKLEAKQDSILPLLGTNIKTIRIINDTQNGKILPAQGFKELMSIIHNSQNMETRCPSSQEQKKSEVLSFALKWLQLEDITLSKISQTQKNIYCMFFLICGSYVLNNKNKTPGLSALAV